EIPCKEQPRKQKSGHRLCSLFFHLLHVSRAANAVRGRRFCAARAARQRRGESAAVGTGTNSAAEGLRTHGMGRAKLEQARHTLLPAHGGELAEGMDSHQADGST